MKLSDVIRALMDQGFEVDPHRSPEADRDPRITGLHCRAQDVVPGGLFVAIKGLQADGHAYADLALSRGAAALVVQQPVRTAVPTVRVDDSRRALAAIAGRFYGHPSHDVFLIGITGTNGKTTTSYLVENMMLAAGLRVGVIGTVNYRYDGRIFDNPVTTPESLDLQRILSEMRQADITHVVMEVSSHALDLDRIAGCRFDLGVFTNLSQDHLDYHGTMEAYWQCKRKFFTDHLNTGRGNPGARAVINTADPRGRALFGEYAGVKRSTGRQAGCDIRPATVRCDLKGIKGELATPRGNLAFAASLIGDHNLENILNAVGTGDLLGLPLEAMQRGIADTKQVPGRLEAIQNTNGKFVFVDYAHTPDALQHALEAIKTLAEGRIICVFGCGGDRDRAKRPLMGEIAAKFSDLAVVTSDNPRGESPLAIIEAVVTGTQTQMSRAYHPDDLRQGFSAPGYVVEPDRKHAIHLAIAASRQGDTVLIAGKGHETYQIIGNRTLPFDDREQARMALTGQH